MQKKETPDKRRRVPLMERRLTPQGSRTPSARQWSGPKPIWRCCTVIPVNSESASGHPLNISDHPVLIQPHKLVIMPRQWIHQSDSHDTACSH